jgi:hypothetical protein
MVTVRVVSDVLFSSLDLLCRVSHEQPLANASARRMRLLPAISFCVARHDSFSHYIALLALIAYRLLNYWNFTLAP